MNEHIIEAKHIGKKFVLRHEPAGNAKLADLLVRTAKRPFKYVAHKLTGRPLPAREPFWALKEVSFDVRRGEIFGIIGHNGAGKSTLLKILSQITPPTTGEIRIHGTVGSLLEVGTGFHPDLSGRENIFFNGAILGMKKKEIERKFDKIVEFAGVEKFIDTPVKHYSSGMLVRLGFSVAVHMDPDVLIVDEVLAVGDESFQRQSLRKMREIARDENRTIIFISHDMRAVQELCTRCMLLEGGRVEMVGQTEEVLARYRQGLKEEAKHEAH